MRDNPSKPDGSLFGSLFDLNGDGVTDCGEAVLMFMLFNELEKEDKQTHGEFERVIDLDDMDIDGI